MCIGDLMGKIIRASELKTFAEIIQSCYREDGLGVEHVDDVVSYPGDSDYKLIYRSKEGLCLYAREVNVDDVYNGGADISGLEQVKEDVGKDYSDVKEEEMLYDSFIVELKEPFNIDGVDAETCEQIVRILGMH